MVGAIEAKDRLSGNVVEVCDDVDSSCMTGQIPTMVWNVDR